MSAALELEQLAPTPTADAGEVVHRLCTTCWPAYDAPDGERFALCGADMRDEREVAGAGPADRCRRCEVATPSHVHVAPASQATNGQRRADDDVE